MQKGDTVRYLNSVGGGKITRVEGQIAYVDEDGFETPMLLKELVVVLPAGHDNPKNGARLMFDQSAIDAVKAREAASRPAPLTKEEPSPDPVSMPVEETAHGERLSVSLAFEPRDIKRLSDTSFAAVLVNDSNYFLALTFLTRAKGQEWKLAYQGELEPNMVLDLAVYSHDQLPGLEHISLQALAYKKDKDFSLKAPIDVQRRIDLTKFYKLHCFRPGKYFDSPVLEVELMKDDVPVRSLAADVDRLARSVDKPKEADRRRRPVQKRPEDNPAALLPLQEIDLHISALLDSTAGLDNKAMLDVQLAEVRKQMKAHARRKGQKIVFIHGKGDGVLRQKVRDLIKREYPKTEWQDASFREYGFGATLVTIR